MTNLEIITPFIFVFIFIVFHFVFKIKRDKKNNEFNPQKDLNNYEIVKINSTHFAVIYKPLMLYIYITTDKKSVLTENVFSNALTFSQKDAFNYLQEYLKHL